MLLLTFANIGVGIQSPLNSIHDLQICAQTFYYAVGNRRIQIDLIE